MHQFLIIFHVVIYFQPSQNLKSLFLFTVRADLWCYSINLLLEVYDIIFGKRYLIRLSRVVPNGYGLWGYGMSMTLKSERLLIRACRKGDVVTLNALLNYDVYSSNNSSETKTWNMTTIVNSIRTQADETLLHVAVVGEDGDTEGVTSTLLRYGADVNARGFRTQVKTALHEAARVGRTRICELLLENGARVDAVKSGDWTPLLIAAAGGYSTVMRNLLQAGANPSHQNREGATPLHLASKNGCVECINVLLGLATPSELTISETGEKIAQRRLLIQARTNNGRTAMHYAARAARAEIAWMLRDIRGVGADVTDVVDVSGACPAHEAAEHADVSTLRAVMHDVAAWTPDCGGLDVLHHAAIGGRVDVACFLLLHNGTSAPVRKADNGKSSWPELQRRLEAQTKKGFTPLALAMLNGHVDLVKFLLSQGARVEKAWIKACDENGFKDCVEATKDSRTSFIDNNTA